MKKIAIVAPSLAIGGCERSVCNISYALKDKYDVYIVLFNGSDIHYDFNGTLIDLKLPAHPNPLKKMYNTLARTLKLKKIAKKYKFDYIYTFLGPTHLINYIKFKNAKKIISCRGFSFLKANLKSYCKMTEKSDAVIFNAEYMCEYFKNQFPHLSDKALTVNNVFNRERIINLSKEECEEEFISFVSSHKTVVSTGRFCKEKGFDNLIKAFSYAVKKDKDSGLVLIGDGDIRKNLEELSNKLGIRDNVYFTGYTDNPYKYMGKCDAYTLSSRNEGFPNVLMEGMILGLPAVAVNCKSGPSEIFFDKFDLNYKTDKIAHGDYGIIIPEIENKEDFDENNLSDIHSLYGDALYEVLNNEELREKYKKLSVLRSEEYTEEKISQKFVEIFENLI
jgi:N-acetylgalactosamine-N,N'-diacetylbacillosaminyl-diphospho-undecaprenol 4-alpha-N-acetylgalactosaminyltransferase